MRYNREVRFRFIGSREECIRYVPQARKLLGGVYNRDHGLGGNDYSYRKIRLPNGVQITVSGNTWMPYIVIDVTALDVEIPPDSVYQFRLAWQPEGILLTPVNEDAPEGWGLPRRTATITQDEFGNDIPAGFAVPDVLGTLDGVNPQVLLNRYENNKYLDEKSYITGVDEEVLSSLPDENPRRRESYPEEVVTIGSGFFVAWQLLYDPLVCISGEYPNGGQDYWDDPANSLAYPQEPGVYTYTVSGQADEPAFEATLIQAQFDDLVFTPAIYEAEGVEWKAHRAEELLYISPAQEGLFQETNTIRDLVGRGPMYRQLRGYANSARMAVEECIISRKQLHDSDEFRPGYFTQAGRGFNATGRHLTLENLLIGTDVAFSTFEDGQDVANIWKDSPPHYANQVATFWDDEDFPGAEHNISHGTASIEEDLYEGELDPPINGIEVCQGFAKREWWLPPTTHHHENQYGIVGFFGSDQAWGREEFTENPFVTFGHHVYFLTQWYDDDDFRGVFGAAAYEQGGQLYLRMVVGIAPEDDLDEPDGYITFKVLTRSVRLTEQNPTYDCDWDLEHEVTYLNSAGWYPQPNAKFNFAPDGSKFVFSMCKVTHSYSQGLDNGATNFTTDRSNLVRPRRTIQNCFIEYRFNQNSLLWEFAEDLEPSLNVKITCETSGTENIYSRSVKGTSRMFCDYDASGVLTYVNAYIDEMSYQRYNSSGPETENYGYKFRKLIFPSGKEVTYEQQYFQDADSLTDPIDIITRLWPGDPYEGNFFRRISYLDVITEDIVYHHIEWVNKYLGKNAFFGTIRSKGTEYVAIDLDQGLDRIQEVLWSGPEKIWKFQQAVILENEDFINSTNRPNGPYPNHVEMTHAKGVYTNDQTIQSHWAEEAGGGDWFYYRNGFPAPYMRFEDNTNGQPEVEIAMYKGVTPIDNLYGRPPFHDYNISCAPGLSLFPTGGDGDNAYVFGNPLVWGSTQTGNIAPLMAHDDNAQCKIVRYKDRLVLRHETVRMPFAIPPTTQSEFSGVDAAYLDVPDDLKVLLYTNFDLDEAVGMDNVTDIYPFGRL